MRGAGATGLLPRRRRDRARSERWAWSVPPITALLVLMAAPFGLLEYLLGMALAAPMVAAAVKRPGGALVVLTVVLPLQKYLIAAVYRLGVPVPAVRGLGWLKEALVLGIVVAGLAAARRAGRRPDVLDRVCLLWLGGLTLYLLFPQILSAAGAPTSLNIRVQGFRANAMFVLLLIGVRHAPLAAGTVRAFRKAIVGVATVIALFGIYQFVDPTGWIRFTYNVIRVPSYQLEVLGRSPVDVYDQFLWMFEVPPRVGSVLISPFEFVDFLLIGLAVALAGIVRGGRALGPAVALGAMGFAIVSSRTRSTLLALALVCLMLLWPGEGRVPAIRVRIATVLVLGVLVVAPFQIGTRITGAEGGSVSSAAHVDEFTTGLEHLIDEPMGKGLGTAPGVGTRFDIESTFVSDNAYLQVGNEIGIVMMAIFVALLVILLHRLRRVPPASHLAPLAQALFVSGLGLCFVGMVHHVWLSLPVAWLFFAGAGLALHRDEDAPVDHRALA